MKIAYAVLALLLMGACDDLPSLVRLEGIYDLVSIDGEPLPVGATTSGELRAGFNATFEVELCGSAGACVILLEGTYTQTGDRLLLKGAEGVTEAMVEGRRVTIQHGGAVFVFQGYTPGD